jgi:hypothetical protein
MHTFNVGSFGLNSMLQTECGILDTCYEIWETVWEAIQTIAQNNNFPNTHIARLKTQIQHKAHTRITKNENKK